MSLFWDDFNRMQDNMNQMMGGGRDRRRGYPQQGPWGDFGMNDFGGFDPMWNDFYSSPFDMWGGGQQQQQGLLKPGDESKMDESAGPSTALQQYGGGGQLQRRQGQGGLQTLACRVNIEDLKDKYAITADVPGFEKENLKVNIGDNNVLTITGEQKKEHVDQSKDRRYIRSERSFGRVFRSIPMPRNIKKESVTASYENGVLHVNVPKTAESESKRQDVRIS